MRFLCPRGIGVDARVDTDLPRSLADIVGKTYTFQLKLNDFNFTSKNQTFTFFRIFPERALAPMAAFVEHGGPNVTQEQVPPTVDTGTVPDLVRSVFSYTTIAESSASSKDEDSTGKKARKKARVD
ncbi:unnamed protein product [Eruca vesicaria subsp. sativa]|uniref:FACT complex subunit SSRP1 n=1 Tax=Eruca vesicaria subsp. sativa TaxID=29727 RepID=A0ABC8J667_ERUVS|nr:unnamed protein product [Eruca vesicaria subsp. sativa]